MCVYPDIIERQQWTIMTNKKSKRKTKASSYIVVGISLREIEEGITSLTDSGEEENVLAMDQ